MGFLTALPALFNATGILSDSTIMKFIQLGMGIIVKGINLVARFRELNEQVQKFVDEGRDPTPEEWQALVSRSDAAHAGIQAEAARRRGPLGLR